MINTLAGLAPHLTIPKNIVITTHVRPDADALGSSLGLYHILKSAGHHVQVITPTDYPKFIHWMDGHDQVVFYSEDKDSWVKEKIDTADIIICTDFSVLSRIETMGNYIRDAKGIKVLIDHHLGPESFADYTLWDPQASSACELVFDFIEQLGYKSLLNKSVASCLYAGIMTDTGSFRFPSTTKKVHLILAELFDAGINHSEIHRLVYDNNRLERLRLLGFSLSSRLVILDDYKTAYIALSADDLAQFEYEQGDTEGIVNYALSVNGIVFAAILMEKEGCVKMSFRSIGNFNVSDFSKQNFNGGGHKNAAGGKSDDAFVDVVGKFLNLLPKYKNEIEAYNE